MSVPERLAPYYEDDSVKLHHGDCIEVMRTLPDNSVDSIVTDPPYGLGFMGKAWDALPPGEDWARECLRVLKPGGHLLAFGGTRTWHRLAVAVEDGGFDIRDSIAWMYGSGFPKSQDIAKAIDKGAPRSGMFEPFAAHYEERRKASGLTHAGVCALGGFFANVNHGGASVNWAKGHNVPTSEQWKILFPALGLSEEWLPLIERVEAEREVIGKHSSGLKTGDSGLTVGGEGGDITVAATADAQKWQGWGTALKPAFEPVVVGRKPLVGTVAANVLSHGVGALNIDGSRVGDRWPANVILDEFTAGRLAEARYFYTAKASKQERPLVGGVAHPTVKPLALMQWLVRLVTPTGGTVLEPFAGSGTTVEASILEGFDCIAIEREAEYLPLITQRINRLEGMLA